MRPGLAATYSNRRLTRTPRLGGLVRRRRRPATATARGYSVSPCCRCLETSSDIPVAVAGATIVVGIPVAAVVLRDWVRRVVVLSVVRAMMRVVRRGGSGQDCDRAG